MDGLMALDSLVAGRGGDGLHPRLRALQHYDLVVANILAGPLIRLAPQLARAIHPGAITVLSGILGEQAREVAATYTMSGFQLLRKEVSHNWATLTLTKIERRNRSQR